MTSWPTVELASVCEEITVGYVSKMSDQYIPSGIPFLRSQDIAPGHIRTDNLKFISEAFHQRLKKSQLSPGDVVIVRTGYPGTAAVVPTSLPIANCADLVIVRPGPQLNPRFLAFALNSPWGEGQIKGRLVGVAQQHFNVKVAQALKVPLPRLPVQNRVASILGTYDDLIEVNRQRITLLEEMARRLFEEWFVRFRVPGDRELSLIDSEVGPVPEGWQVVRLEEMYDTSSGGTPSRKCPQYYGGNIQWVKTKELLDGPIWQTEERITEEGLAKSSAKVFPVHTVLVAMYGATIGQLGVLVREAATNQACCAVLSTSGWAYPFLMLRYNRERLIGLRAGAAQQNISQAVIRGFKVLRPPKDLLQRFEEYAGPILTHSFVLHQQNANLAAQRDLLLPRLISGELPVSSAEREMEAAE